MPENRMYLPEGMQGNVLYTISDIQEAQKTGAILEGTVLRCEENHDLVVSLGGLTGRIPREEAIHPLISGAGREIAVLSLVGKPVCCCVTSLEADEAGRPRLTLSRRRAQAQALDWMLRHLAPGMVIACKVTHLESFGAFVDMGCGVISLLPIESLSVSRITHPGDRVRVGQHLLAVVTAVEPEKTRFHLSHRELLGTWMENASRFRAGQTVRGIVRSLQDYGIFVELTPNLSGLADPFPQLSVGDAVSVYIKSIQPEKMKVKLQIIDRLPRPQMPEPIRYQITDGQLERWVYSPPGCRKAAVETVFTQDPS